MISYRWSFHRYMHPVIASECEHTYTCQLSLSLRLSLSLSHCLSLYRDLRRRHISTDRSDKKKYGKKRECSTHTHTITRSHSHSQAGRQTGTQISSPSLYRYRCCYRYRRLQTLFSFFFNFWSFFLLVTKKK